MPSPMSDPPLDGIKVLDLSRVLAGPWCAQTLADLGADVWKVEEPERGDDTRAWMPPEINGKSTYYMSANRSKRSIAVDLKHPDGQRIVREMAAKADVLVENYKKGTLEQFGLGYEELAALNPGLVYCSISGYGRTGPRAERAGYDFAIQAESGLMSITGEPGGAPMKHGMAITDLVTGMNAVQAVLAALLARSRTGKGQLIDMALLDCGIALFANMASGHIVTGAEPAGASATLILRSRPISFSRPRMGNSCSPSAMTANSAPYATRSSAGPIFRPIRGSRHREGG